MISITQAPAAAASFASLRQQRRAQTLNSWPRRQPKEFPRGQRASSSCICPISLALPPVGFGFGSNFGFKFGRGFCFGRRRCFVSQFCNACCRRFLRRQAGSRPLARSFVRQKAGALEPNLNWCFPSQCCFRFECAAVAAAAAAAADEARIWRPRSSSSCKMLAFAVANANSRTLPPPLFCRRRREFTQSRAAPANICSSRGSARLGSAKRKAQGEATIGFVVLAAALASRSQPPTRPVDRWQRAHFRR